MSIRDVPGQHFNRRICYAKCKRRHLQQVALRLAIPHDFHVGTHLLFRMELHRPPLVSVPFCFVDARPLDTECTLVALLWADWFV